MATTMSTAPRWEPMNDGANPAPYVDVNSEDGAATKRVIAAGVTKDQIPWSLAGFRRKWTLSDPGDVSEERTFEFFLGGTPGFRGSLPGGLGGAVMQAVLPAGSHLEARVSVFEVPDIVVFVLGWVSPVVSRVSYASGDHDRGDVILFSSAECPTSFLLSTSAWPTPPLRLGAHAEDGQLIASREIPELTRGPSC